MDEIGLLIRLIKPIVVGIVMACSLYWITQNMGIAIIGMLIPLVLGLVRIGESLAYSITAITFVVAIVFALIPPWVKRDAALFMKQAVNQVNELSASAENPVKTQPADQTPGNSHKTN